MLYLSDPGGGLHRRFGDLVWTEPASFVVESADAGLKVTAHAGLSDAHVRAACGALGEHSEMVYRAWQEHVGNTWVIPAR